MRSSTGLLGSSRRLSKPAVGCVQSWVISDLISISAMTRVRRAKRLASRACPGVYLRPRPSSVSRHDIVTPAGMAPRKLYCDQYHRGSDAGGLRSPQGPKAGHVEHAQRVARITKGLQPRREKSVRMGMLAREKEPKDGPLEELACWQAWKSLSSGAHSNEVSAREEFLLKRIKEQPPSISQTTKNHYSCFSTFHSVLISINSIYAELVANNRPFIT